LKSARAFAGFVDHRVGNSLGGWAVDRTQPDTPCDVDIYANGELVLRARADRLRPDLIEVSPSDQRKGFLVDINPEMGSGSHVEVCFGNTSVRIPPTDELAQHLGRFPIHLRQLSPRFSNRWAPVPPASMITHITGVRDDHAKLRTMYVQNGAALAADTYDIPLEIGFDLQRQDCSIVDLGCGCGRIATFLAPWLEHTQFLGLDVWRPGIVWATKNITASYESYRFQCLAKGGTKYQAHVVYPLPVDGPTTDYVISTSLFTHLGMGACDGYLRELGRILKPGGLAYTTFFFRDEHSVVAAEQRARAHNMPLIKEPSAWHFGKGDYLDIFHDFERVRSVAATAGLRPVLFRAGAWRGMAFSSTNPAAYQDLLLFQKV
jgi:SAM-dependent methyltransferase